MPDSHGTITRCDGGVVVKVLGDEYLGTLPGVEPLGSNMYGKTFSKKKIFLPDEYDAALDTYMSGANILVLGINGYSRLTEEQCQAWGVKHGAYEQACKFILKHAVEQLLDSFRDIEIRIVHGASNLGVDGSAIEAAKKLRISQLGFSCPDFMMYVEDDDVPVYVAASQEAYADAFVRTLDVLITANGRNQAFQMDILAALKYLKDIIPVNVLKSISTSGGPPAWDGEGKVDDAVAAFEMLVHSAKTHQHTPSLDQFRELVEGIGEKLVAIGRKRLPPECAFA